MPWEISIINGTVNDRKPLGGRETVIAAFATELPGAVFRRSAVLPAEVIDKMPEFVREEMRREKLEADFEEEDLSIQFYANDVPVFDCVNAEVRGNGNPVPALTALCVKRGWSVIDSSDKSVVDLSSRAAGSAWDRFREWRNKAIDQITTGGSAGE